MQLSDISSTVKVPTSPKTDFFKYWLIFLRPFHHLTDREIDLATAFLKKRYELGKDIKNDDLLDKIVLNEDYKREIRTEVGITLTHFQVIMGKLRNNKFIQDNKINPRFIPRIKEENGQFLLLVYFDFTAPVSVDKLNEPKKEKKEEKKTSKRGRKRKQPVEESKEEVVKEVVEEAPEFNMQVDFEGEIDLDDETNN